MDYFRKIPLYRKIKLRYPVTREMVERFSKVMGTDMIDHGEGGRERENEKERMRAWQMKERITQENTGIEKKA